MWSLEKNRRRVRAASSGSRVGFTLVEMLVAVAVLGIMMGIVYGAFARASAVTVRMESYMDLNHVSRFIISRLADDLASASMLPNNQRGFMLGENMNTNGKLGAESKLGVEDKVRMDRISFTGFGRRLVSPGTASDQAVIMWYVHKNPDKDTFTLMRSESFNTLDEVDREQLAGGGFDITDTLRSFQISYLKISGAGAKWVDEFDSKTEGKLPEMVQLKFTLRDDKGSQVNGSTILPLGARL